MKIFIYLLSAIAIALLIFNTTKLDFDSLLEGDSVVALITIFASLCALALLQILRISKAIEQKSKK